MSNFRGFLGGTLDRLDRYKDEHGLAWGLLMAVTIIISSFTVGFTLAGCDDDTIVNVPEPTPCLSDDGKLYLMWYDRGDTTRVIVTLSVDGIGAGCPVARETDADRNVSQGNNKGYRLHVEGSAHMAIGFKREP